eukprot:GILI01027258.1.p1 GENE.GILI01027258.1~~GILI01027258.1.p1  ORF type:complete len:475 (-),score=56.80 GILI01027258.1:36-1427(-)
MSRIAWGNKIPEKEQTGPKQQTLARYQAFPKSAQPGSESNLAAHVSAVSSNSCRQQPRGDQQLQPDFYMDGVLVPGNSVYNASPYSRAFVGAWSDHRAQQSAAEITTDFDELLLAPYMPMYLQQVQPTEPAPSGATASPGAPPFINVANFPHLQNLPCISYPNLSIDPSCRAIFKDCVFYLNSCDSDRLVSLYLLEKLIRFMGGVTVMGNSTRVVFVVSQHLAANKDERVRPERRGAIIGGAEVSIRNYFPPAATDEDSDFSPERSTTRSDGRSTETSPAQPVRLLAANASIKQSTATSTSASIARNNKKLANAARYVHPHFILACAKMGWRVPSAPFQTMLGEVASSSGSGVRPLVFNSLDAIPIHYADTLQKQAKAKQARSDPPAQHLASLKGGILLCKEDAAVGSKRPRPAEQPGKERKSIVFELSQAEGASTKKGGAPLKAEDDDVSEIEVLDLTFTQA